MTHFDNILNVIRAEILSALPNAVAPVRLALMGIFGGQYCPVRAAIATSLCSNKSGGVLGAALELIHVSVHQLHVGLDDPEGSRYTFGVAGDVLTGDYLCTGAFRLLVKCNDIHVMDIVARAVQEACENEVLLAQKSSGASSTDFQSALTEAKQRARSLGVAAGLASSVLGGHEDAIQLAMGQYGQYIASAHALLELGIAASSIKSRHAFYALALTELDGAYAASDEFLQATANDDPLTLCTVMRHCITVRHSAKSR